MKTLGIALVGVGYWGRNLLRVLLRAKGAKLRWAVDTDEARREWAARVAPHAMVAAFLHDALRDHTVGAVVVATPPATHYALGQKVLAAGKHLFVEKPMCATYSEAATLADEARVRGLVLGVGHVYLHHPAVAHLKRAYVHGFFGDDPYLMLERGNPGPPYPVGVVPDLAPHEVALALDLLGWPQAVRGELISSGSAAFVELQCAGGRVFIHVSWRAPHRLRRVSVYGARGAAEFDETAATPLVYRRAGRDTRTQGRGHLTYGRAVMLTTKLPQVEPLAAEVADFVAACRTGRSPRADGDAGAAVVRVLEAVGASLTAGGRWIPP